MEEALESIRTRKVRTERRKKERAEANIEFAFFRLNTLSLLLIGTTFFLFSIDALGGNPAYLSQLEELRRRNPEKAIELAQEILKGDKEVKAEEEAKIAMHLGVAYFVKEKYAEALDQFNKVVQKSINLRDKKLRATAESAIAGVLMVQNKPDEALSYLEKAEKLSEEVADTALTLKIKINKAISLYNSGSYKKSVDILNNLISKIDKNDLLYPVALVFRGSGSLKLNIAEEAFSDLKEALDHALISPYHKSKAFVELSEIYFLNGDTAEALKAVNSAISIAKEVNALTEQMLAFEKRSDLYSRMDSSNLALESYKFYKYLSDSLFDIEKSQAISNLLYENEKRKNEFLIEENAVEKARREKANSFLVYTLIALGLYIILTAVAIYFYLRTRKFNKQLIAFKEQLEHQSKDIKEKNQDLHELNQEKNNLISIVAHDLKAPLQQIEGLVGLIKFEQEKGANDDIGVRLNMMEESLKRATSMISRILDINSINQKKIIMTFEKIDLTDIMIKAGATFRENAEKKRIKLHYDFAEGQHYVLGDEEYLIQILENLISNALKFTSEEKNVYLRVHSDSAFTTAEIKDEGPGIEEAEKKNLFIPYKKLAPRPTAGEHSSGFGLSIVKKYTEEMGAKILVESKKGEGASFKITFRSQKLN